MALVDTKTSGVSTSTVPVVPAMENLFLVVLDAHASLVPPLGLDNHGGRGVAVAVAVVLARRTWREVVLSLAWVRSTVGEAIESNFGLVGAHPCDKEQSHHYRRGGGCMDCSDRHGWKGTVGEARIVALARWGRQLRAAVVWWERIRAMRSGAKGEDCAAEHGARLWTPTLKAYRVVEICRTETLRTCASRNTLPHCGATPARSRSPPTCPRTVPCASVTAAPALGPHLHIWRMV
jgi:hypothetical protein